MIRLILTKTLDKGRGSYPRHTRATALGINVNGTAQATFWDGRTVLLWPDEFTIDREKS